VPIYKKVNKNFFKKWNRQMAYVLGFFAADGYITLNKRGANFWCIDITDKDLLYNIRDIIESEHKISERIGTENNKNQYRLQIGSKEMCNDLRKLGFQENKTKSLSTPNVPQKYFSDFVRGYFDGDGNVWIGFLNKKRKTPTKVITTVFTSCSYDFLKVLKDRLEIFGITKGVIREMLGNYFHLTYSILNSLKLYNFMYNRGLLDTKGLFLERKKRVFDKYIKLRS
jgi:hypothetical protein